jgi:hypothetical protein
MTLSLLLLSLILSVFVLVIYDYLFPTLLPQRFYPLLWLSFFLVAVIIMNFIRMLVASAL